MPKTESGITRTKLPKKGKLYRLEGRTNPSFLYVVREVHKTDIHVTTLRPSGALVPCNVKLEIFELMWLPYTILVEDAKSNTIAALSGLI